MASFTNALNARTVFVVVFSTLTPSCWGSILFFFMNGPGEGDVYRLGQLRYPYCFGRSHLDYYYCDSSKKESIVAIAQ